jgi:hypothetical protein
MLQDHNSLERTETKNSATATANETDTDTATPDHDLQDLRDNHITEQGGDNFLVDWYGPNDPEVSIYSHRFYVANPSNTPLRINRIGPASRSFWWLRKYVFSPFPSIWRVLFTSLANQASWPSSIRARLSQPWDFPSLHCRISQIIDSVSSWTRGYC